MIRVIKSYDECRDFASGFQADPNFSDPMLSDEEQVQCNLINAIDRTDRYVLGVYRDATMIGLFTFLILRDEQYIEMLVGLSRDKEAYLEVLHYLEQCYPGYSADFVFNPGNCLLKELLDLRNAEYEPEQQKMVLGTPVLGIDTTGPSSTPSSIVLFTTRICTGLAKRSCRPRTTSTHSWQSTMAKSLAIWM